MNSIFHPQATSRRTSVVAAILLASVVTGVLLRIFIIDSFIVKGNSMAPTIEEGDYVFVNKTAFKKADPKRGDIVVGEFRDIDRVAVIKRVIGLPGEWIFIENGEIKVAKSKDGERKVVSRLDSESYIESLTEYYEYRLDPFEYFVLGDNGLGSVDSRELGPIDIYSIKGEVVYVFRPKMAKFVNFN